MPQIPIYTTRGDWAAMIVDQNLYDVQGEWIGWVDDEHRVFSVRGEYVGWLSKDFRVLGRRDTTLLMPRQTPPATPPPRLRMPTSAPLAPLMAELTFDTIDVFEEAPHRLEPMDLDQLPDLD